MLLFPNAKINIGLNIVRKRKDGFHNIETVFYPIGLSDILEVVKKTNSTQNAFKYSGIKIPGNTNENLCRKAFYLMEKDYKISAVSVQLHKFIPMGAGLGGGSSDAAFFIQLMNQIFSLNMTDEKKLFYARQLGSDCSFFIKNKPCFATQRGEKLQPVDLNLRGYYLVLVCPPVEVSTKDAYAEIIPAKPTVSLKELIYIPVTKWSENIINDFEKTVFTKFPEIEKIKNHLYGLNAIYASMSGSGSAVFGIFYSPPPQNKLKKLFKDNFLWEEWL